MFSLSSIVSTISICDNNSTSYQQFINSHQERHNHNVLVAQSNTQRKVGFSNHRKEPPSYKGGYKKNQGKLIKQKQKPSNNNYRKQSNYNHQKPPNNNYQKQLNYNHQKTSNNNFQKQSNNYLKPQTYNYRNNGDVHFIIQYSFNNKNMSYPLNKILSHLSNNFNNNFKNSLNYNSFKVKYIKVKDCDKSKNYISIYVGINYNIIQSREINNLGNRFQDHPLYDNNTQVRFYFVDFKVN